MKRLLLLLAFVALSVLSFGQNSFYDLKLKSGTYPVYENAEQDGIWDFQSSELHNNYFYRVIQFHHIPTNEVKAQMKNEGIELLNYLPENAFFAKISAQINPGQLGGFDIRAVLPILPEYKLSRALHTGDIPAHALQGSDVIVNVLPFDKRDVADISSKWEVIEYQAHRNLLQVLVPVQDLTALAQSNTIYYIEEIEAPAVPENYVGRTNHRTNFIATDYSGGLKYDGRGITVAMGDDGTIGFHIDYQGRIDQQYASPSYGNHGDHVAGTIMGAGNFDRKGRGNATGAFLQVYDPFDNVDSSFSHYVKHNVRITSTSYGNGCNAGYTSYASFADQTIRQREGLMHVFSAGNSGSSNCGYGAGSGWGNVTGGIKVGKNVIAVGNLTFIDNIANSSSRGPAEDGRIKPDVCAVGTNVYSTIDVNTYANFTGTSMACPGVSGSLATLYQAYEDIYNTEPTSDIIKAAVMNSAEDLGNPGPDFTYGYGRINVRRAYEIIEANNFIRDSITQGQNHSHVIQVPSNIEQVRVMIYWNDYEGTPNAFTPLVNNLNMQVVTPTMGTFNPWVLNSTPSASLLNADATRGVDNINNTEQVTIDNPDFTTMTVTVNGASIPQGPQHYVLVYEFVTDDVVLTYPIGGETFDPSDSEVIRWDALGNTGPFTVKYSSNNGATWTTLSSNVPGNLRYYSWNVPNNNPTENALISVTRGTSSDTSHATFTVAGTPSGLSATTICPDTITLQWNAVPGASAYRITKLGAEYMDSVAQFSTLSGEVFGHNPNVDNYYAVQAVLPNGGLGPRSVALEVPAGLSNCVIDDDVALTILSPVNGFNPGCDPGSKYAVTLEIENMGQNSITNIPVFYTFNGTTYNDTITSTIPAGGVQSFTFQDSINTTTGGTVNAGHTFLPDDNLYNNTDDVDFSVGAGTLVTAPFTEDFDNFSTCATTSSCGFSCALQSGWVNVQNGFGDEADWRTNSGGTPSSSTGPFGDHTGGGNYLYVESSSCFEQTALLLTPCVDLSANSVPYATFWYHMRGGDMGELHVDVISDGILYEDVMAPISGNQGSQWQNAQVNLAPFAGTIINVRFRAITGPDFQSDIAIDDVDVVLSNSSPLASFTPDVTAPCIGEIVTLQDNSSNFPATYSWSISPSTFQYVNGTNASSANPQVVFNTAGTYSVSLTVTNNNGVNTDVQSSAVTAGNGNNLPLLETFDFYSNCSTNSNCEATVCNFGSWDNLENGVEDDIDWRVNSGGTPSNNTGPSSGFNGSSRYIYLEASGGCANREAVLVSDCYDLTGITSPQLSFYYHMFGGDMGSLSVDIIADGQMFSNVTPTISGNQGNTWVQRTVDLSAFSGNSIKIVFRGVTGTDFESDIAIDLVQLTALGVQAPAASFTTNQNNDTICNPATVVFTSNSTNNPTSYSWNFGTGATPSTSNQAGPISVNYLSVGPKIVTLTVGNAGGTDTYTYNMYVTTAPNALFFQTDIPGGVTIAPNNTPITQIDWDFGDGTTITTFDTQPVTHNYSSNGTYTVTMVAQNLCGADTFSADVVIDDISISEFKQLDYNLYPNPSSGVLNLSFNSITEENIRLEIVDITGSIVWSEELSSGKSEYQITPTELSAGTYIVRLMSNRSAPAQQSWIVE
jgi:PKD repeat protein